MARPFEQPHMFGRKCGPRTAEGTLQPFSVRAVFRRLCKFLGRLTLACAGLFSLFLRKELIFEHARLRLLASAVASSPCRTMARYSLPERDHGRHKVSRQLAFYRFGSQAGTPTCSCYSDSSEWLLMEQQRLSSSYTCGISVSLPPGSDCSCPQPFSAM